MVIFRQLVNGRLLFPQEYLLFPWKVLYIKMSVQISSSYHVFLYKFPFLLMKLSFKLLLSCLSCDRVHPLSPLANLEPSKENNSTSFSYYLIISLQKAGFFSLCYGSQSITYYQYLWCSSFCHK